MTDSHPTPHFKNSTMLFYKNIYIFIIYIPTRDISVHKNYPYVQGWNPTTNYFENRKNSKITEIEKNGLKFDFDVC